MSERVRSRLAGEPWFIDHWQLEKGRVKVSGWAFPETAPARGEPAPLLLNGEAFDRAAMRMPRPDVAARFWQRKDAIHSGFSCEKAISAEQLYAREYLELRYATSADALPHGLAPSWFLLDPRLEAALPEAENRFRVIGSTDELSFRLGGASDFMRLDGALAAFAGRHFDGFDRVLDWGCGCGRIARYAAREIGARLAGCDIDAANVAWCRDHLAGEYVATGLREPLPFADASFDLAYGVSVFTHMLEPLQDFWLGQLQRILRPGGWALMTVHGETALDYAGLAPAEHAALGGQISAAGLLGAGVNHQLDAEVDTQDQYVNVWHAPDYIRSHWGRWFEIVAVVPGYLFTHDLVVMRRR